MTLAQLFHVPSGFWPACACCRLRDRSCSGCLAFFGIDIHSLSIFIHHHLLGLTEYLCWTSQAFIHILCILLSCHCVSLSSFPRAFLPFRIGLERARLCDSQHLKLINKILPVLLKPPRCLRELIRVLARSICCLWTTLVPQMSPINMCTYLHLPNLPTF